MSSPQFLEAAAFLSNASSLSGVSNTVKLELYGLFKYITVSPTPNTSRPSIFDITGRAKWDTWVSIGLQYKESAQAEEKYIKIAESLGWKQAQQPYAEENSENMWDTESESEQSRGSEGLGVSVSVMSAPEKELEESIHGFVVNGDITSLSALLDRSSKTDINQRDEYGYTPLHLAADRGNLAIAKLLLDKGANTTLLDEDELTALGLAEVAGNAEIVSLLSQSHLPTR